MARRLTRTTRSAWVLLAPFLLVFLVFMLYPLAQSLVLSGRQSFGPGSSEWVGTDNYVWLFSDPNFWKATRNTIVFTLGSLLVQLPLALGLALLLNTPGLRGRSVYRLVFFSPQLMGLVFAAMLGALVFEKRAGLLNIAMDRVLGWAFQPSDLPAWAMSLVGVESTTTWLDFPWLQSLIMPTLIIIALWMYVGFNMVYFLAALQNIDRSLMEAAAVDGAGPFGRFLNVTLPGIRPVASIVVLLSIVGSFQLFELPYILLDQTAGPDKAGLTLVMYLYQRGFGSGDLGYASAIGWVLGLFLITVALVQVWFARRGDG